MGRLTSREPRRAHVDLGLLQALLSGEGYFLFCYLHSWPWEEQKLGEPKRKRCSGDVGKGGHSGIALLHPPHCSKAGWVSMMGHGRSLSLPLLVCATAYFEQIVGPSRRGGANSYAAQYGGKDVAAKFIAGSSPHSSPPPFINTLPPHPGRTAMLVTVALIAGWLVLLSLGSAGPALHWH